MVFVNSRGYQNVIVVLVKNTKWYCCIFRHKCKNTKYNYDRFQKRDSYFYLNITYD